MSQLEQSTEALIQSKNLNAPRLSPAALDANITDIEYVKHVSKSGQVLRWAVVTAQNGFAFVGKPSVAVSPENDNQEVGEKVALDNTRNEMWGPMGYALKQKLFEQTEAQAKIGEYSQPYYPG